jgi:hypothetical protein
MAASFLVAFGLGISLPRWITNLNPQQPQVAVKQPSAPPVTAVASHDDAKPPLRHESFKPIGNLQLVVDGPGGQSTPVGDLPVYELPDGELPGSTEQWLTSNQPALSPAVVQSLQQRGHQVERRVEYVPVLLNDGRQVIVPVEGYQIRPAKRRPY